LRYGIVRRAVAVSPQAAPRPWSILGGAMTAAPVPVVPDPDPPAPRPRRALARVVGRMLGKAWDDSIFSAAAPAAF